ncbi:MAG TPA: hypothetical protein VMR06_03845 [Dokdonella sp.]|uniref:hypothetical protein n=1 Tax=Dokdonella sp. TaxID=2291710 RepID=UPI002CA6F426|nr:hypothetical protein [Dokdonella sp.]HUD41110.1 hypothetical protein [Dokdonella sp.]
MSIRARGLLLALLTGSAGAHPAWEPVWTTTWNAADASATFPGVLRRADDGALFVGVEPLRSGSTRAGVLRLEADGTVGWVHERPDRPGPPADVVLLADHRVALVGGFTAPFVRTIDALSGALVWEAGASDAVLWVEPSFFQTRQLAQTPAGELLMRADDGTDFVVPRFDASGQALPAWRWTAADEVATADSIVALPDGGAIVAGRGDTIGGGYRTVRFGADGGIVYTDTELGEIGNPLGAAWLTTMADGAALLVGSPETHLGTPGVMAWKIGADGSRLWTRVLSNQSQQSSTFTGWTPVLAPNGDLRIAVHPPEVLRLLRIDTATGDTLSDVASAVAGLPMAQAIAPNGRSLLVGYAFIPGGGGRTYATMAEFDADGALCRQRSRLPDLGSLSGAVAGAEGWTVVGTSDAGSVVVQRYDADGACGENLFADDFEPR